jgi:uncharacterized protein
VVVVLKIIGFILWVNFLPPLANIICGDRFGRAVDGGRLWFDEQPIFGRHKTIRGIVVSFLGGILVSPLLGVAWWVGGVAAMLAMAGDLLSSFIKRRPNFPSGRNIIVLDQFFESLFPVLFLGRYLEINGLQVVVVLLCFILVAHPGSCFWNFIMYRSPLENYPRTIRSTVRLREWRACHMPLARWQTMFNLTSFLSHDILLTRIFRLAGLYDNGLQNSLKVQVEEKTFCFPDLPEAFDGFRILLLTDLHLDGVDGLTEKLSEQIGTLQVDLCLIGGDIRMKTYGPVAPCLRHLRSLLSRVRSRHGILGVLGNHDCIEMTPDFEEAGLVMLINDSWEINEDGSRIWVVGVDDPHYYKTHDAQAAYGDVPEGGFCIFLAHSPEAYKQASTFRARLYLCGHTHGGQICLPGRGALFTNSRAPRFTASGSWQYRGMTGYTSRGAGVSGIPLRFNCPGEISLLTLRKGKMQDEGTLGKQ